MYDELGFLSSWLVCEQPNFNRYIIYQSDEFDIHRLLAQLNIYAQNNRKYFSLSYEDSPLNDRNYRIVIEVSK